MRDRSLGSVGLLLALASAIGLTSCSSGGPDPDVFRSTSAGISLTVPEGWHATRRRFTVLLDPRERLTLTSFSPRAGTKPGRRCSPDPLLGQMPRTGVTASLLEYLDNSARRHIDPRPRRFRLREAAPGFFDCFAPPIGRADAYALNFGDHGRAFQLLVAVGKRATSATRRAAEAALDSLRVEQCDLPLPSETHPACRRPLPH